ncbi:uncharacterized protein N7496_000983 [Penicillium cataractarum]|uniref:Serine hydrolase domain-containing protein n=1 Tax=Penicillium cataractarum TaxID=2100454 RepID=A0A9X0B6G6_9EURO|nr:uncharacterized protein N7496_000983 [Penicillium cataractarum]KAJ5389915.1 hypothetical protein N7496_000983 [Penicillium cataractarum]
MRFLCLHGRGTNSDILEAQLAPLRRRLAQHTLEFFDAQSACAPAPEISDLYPPPYLCWYEHGRPDEVSIALDELCAVLDEDGPYDGLIGFSEGAALIASLLLFDELAGRRPRIQLAVLFNSVVPLTAHPAGVQHTSSLLSELVHGHHDHYLALLKTDEQVDDPLAQAWGFSPAGPLRIAVSTVHIIGDQDPFAPSSQLVVKMCQPERAQVLRHGGSHALPQAGDVLDQCAELIETSIMLSSLKI